MRVTATRTGLLFAALIVAAVSPVKPGFAARSMSEPGPCDTGEGSAGTDGRRGLDMSNRQRRSSQCRLRALCRSKTDGVYLGANLDCDKAETSRSLPGATAWCRENPGSKIIPMSATGHDTIYEWFCRRHRAIAGKPVVTVDSQGYIADYWREIR